MIGRMHVLVAPKSITKQLGLKEGRRAMMRLEDTQTVMEPLPSDHYDIPAEVVHEPYPEPEDEPKAEDWLRRHAGR